MHHVSSCYGSCVILKD
jgi:hypothetical protein